MTNIHSLTKNRSYGFGVEIPHRLGGLFLGYWAGDPVKKLSSSPLYFSI
jgi:hypothetical protein